MQSRKARGSRSPRPVSPLYRDIWEVVRRIPRGRVATYGQIAALAGRPGQPRLVGYAMHNVPEGSAIPWHRVINSQGRISLRSGDPLICGEQIQQVLLRREGVRFDRAGRCDLSRYQWRPRRAVQGVRGPSRAGTPYIASGASRSGKRDRSARRAS